MSFSSKYYFILGIKETASISDVKKAYRTLAKKYHPDKNKEADARERFIEVNEAYEYIVNKPKAPARGKMRSEAYYAHKEKVYKEWVKRNEARVKAKAKRAAEMKYNDWEKMDLRSATMFDFLSTLVFIVVLAIAIPIILGLLEDSIYEEYLVPIFAVLAFISVPAFAYFLTWKDYKIGDILKKKDQIK